MHGSPRLTPEILLRAYAEGLFPMAERRGDPTLYWVSPEKRGIIPLDAFHWPTPLARTQRSGAFPLPADRCFADVMRACAAPAPGRTESWINDEILRLYTALHASGHAHSIECWQDGELAGGLYGGLVHLVDGLRRGGFALLDTQFITAHLARFGAVEIARERYLLKLHDALNR